MTFEENLDKLMSFKSDLAGDILDGIGSDISISELMPKAGPVGANTGYVTVDDVDRLDGRSFEVFCRLLYEKKAVSAEITKKSRGDGGVDLVVFNDNNTGFLCQCKHTSNDEIGWDAVKEIAAGSPAYMARYPGYRFQKLAVTNKFFNKTAIEQATHLSIKLVDRDSLIAMLREEKIPLIELDEEILTSTN